MSEFVELVLSDAKERMEKAIAHSRSEFASVRSGRANPQLVERLSVEAYGVEMRVVEVASVSVPEARQLMVTPHDPANLESVERAIRVSDLGVSPSNDGRSIRLNFPPLTEERRKETGACREEHGGGRPHLDPQHPPGGPQGPRERGEDNQLSEDELARAEKELDKLTQASEASVDSALASKEDELLEV